MSTRLLSSPGKAYELSDDLESLWFVLLFEGLHFVKHNNPSGINMRFLFDQADVSLKTGTHTGGSGKIRLYSNNGFLMNRLLEFDSKPFTNLIREIYRLFKSLNLHYVAIDEREAPIDSVKRDVRKLKNCAEIVRVLSEALNSGEWPAADKVEDQYPPIKRPSHEQKETIALSYAHHSLMPSSTVSIGKRKREEDDPPVFNEVKRPKIAPPLWKWIMSKWTLLVGV